MTKSTNGSVKLERSEWFKIAAGLFVGVMLPGAATAFGLYVQVQKLQTTVDVKFESNDEAMGEMKQDIRELRERH